MTPHDGVPQVTALICTRNRGALIARTLETVLSNTHACYEVLVVDQSDDEATARTVAGFAANPRLRYIRSATKGLGVARNVGLQEARAEIVVCTDDDCETPPHWLTCMAHVFATYPDVAVAFCNVEPGPYDARFGFIPTYHRSHSKLVKNIGQKPRARGIGAGLAVRRTPVLALGGFDERLGVGARFPSCEDGDMAVRALLRGYQVYETADVSVIHNGFRTYAEGRFLGERDWVGIGAAYAKPLRCGDLRILPVIAYELAIKAIWPPIWNLLRLRRPRGVARSAAFMVGFRDGWRAPIDPATLRFVVPASEPQGERNERSREMEAEAEGSVPARLQQPVKHS